jgi:predicted 3-demethylubiquinone-9 3-methyltransferase (glyoxalase superfamily)
MMTKPAPTIVPHLWFDKEAYEAAQFYVTVFPDSEVRSRVVIPDTPSGDSETVSFKVWGHDFMAISAGPMFKINPSVSFIVNFDPSRESDAKGMLDRVWERLFDGGTALMPIGEYPFSKRYGWIQDKYGVSWQLILTNPEGEERPPIVPNLMFVGDNSGKAEEAMNYYVSVFRHSRKGHIARYPAGMEPDREGTIMFEDFMLENVWFSAMDSARAHGYQFNEAISFMVYCDTQDEIDYYWDKLSAVPEAEQCGWCKDRFGLSWQVVPRDMDEMLSRGTPEQIQRVTEAFMKMKKFDLAELRRAAEA